MQPVVTSSFEGGGLFPVCQVCFGLFVWNAILAVTASADTDRFLPAIPEGTCLQAYDDCGADVRQPHELIKDCYHGTLDASDTGAGLKERPVVFNDKGIQAVYANI